MVEDARPKQPAMTHIRWTRVDPDRRHSLNDDRPRYREFREAVERAEADAEVALVEAVVKGIPRNPILAYKMLENRSPEWRRWRIAPEPVVVETPPPPPTPDPYGVTIGQLRRRAMERAKIRRGEPPEGGERRGVRRPQATDH